MYYQEKECNFNNLEMTGYLRSRRRNRNRPDPGEGKEEARWLSYWDHCWACSARQ